MQPCKHLDFDELKYGDGCTLMTIEGFSCEVRHWRRNVVPYEGAPVNVQFCAQGRGRINGIFQCYNAGEMPCYVVDPTEEEK